MSSLTNTIKGVLDIKSKPAKTLRPKTMTSPISNHKSTVFSPKLSLRDQYNTSTLRKYKSVSTMLNEQRKETQMRNTL